MDKGLVFGVVLFLSSTAYFSDEPREAIAAFRRAASEYLSTRKIRKKEHDSFTKEIVEQARSSFLLEGIIKELRGENPGLERMSGDKRLSVLDGISFYLLPLTKHIGADVFGSYIDECERICGGRSFIACANAALMHASMNILHTKNERIVV